MKLLHRLRRWFLVRRTARWVTTLDSVDFYLAIADHVPIPEPALRDLMELRAEILGKFSRAGQVARVLEQQRLPIALNRQLEPIRVPWDRGRLPYRWWECDRLRREWLERFDRQRSRRTTNLPDPEASR